MKRSSGADIRTFNLFKKKQDFTVFLHGKKGPRRDEAVQRRVKKS